MSTAQPLPNGDVEITLTDADWREARRRTRRVQNRSSMTPTRNPLLAAALAYVRRGWFVLPLKPGTKEPLTPHGYKSASISELQVRRWWKRYPDANVGIALGKAYGLVVVDVDGPSGRDLLARLERENGAAFPRTCTATSGRPHRKHLYFAYPENRELRRLQGYENAALDILVDGYVVAPPSIHPKTGKSYRWLANGPLAPLPTAILNVSAKTWRQNITHRGPLSIGEIIPDGQRHTRLTSFAGTMRRRGSTEEEIFAALRVANARRCDPPLAEREVERIAHSIGTKPTMPFQLSEPITDINVARYFATLERDAMRYCVPWRKWLIWDGTRWKPDATLEAQRRIEQMARSLFELLGEVEDNDEREKMFAKLQQYTRHRKLEDVEARARTQQPFVIDPDALDRDPWLFNVANGTVDLRTGALQVHAANDLITKVAPIAYDASATAPRWQQFLNEITQGHEALMAFLQRAVGYTLVGATTEHVLFFCYGDGANGKTTFLETLFRLFGDYAVTIDFETLLHRHDTNAQRDLPRLHHARFVSASEAPTNARWNEKMVKQLTGGDTLAGRWLYREKFEFTPTHTLWCRANDQPNVSDLSEGFWRRMQLVPFTAHFREGQRDPHLAAALRQELPGILNWAVAGCRAWQEGGLKPPRRVTGATTQYRKEEDVYGQFVAERCARRDAVWTDTTTLYSAFEAWWRETRGARSTPPSRKSFGKGLAKQRGLKAEKQRRVRGWRGLALRST